jgi:hypothetical protein
LKERSPQPLKISPKKDADLVGQHVQQKYKSPVVDRSYNTQEEVKQVHTPPKSNGGRSGTHSKNHSPHHSPAAAVVEDDYNEVYKMLEEMAGIVKMNLNHGASKGSSSDEEAKIRGEESDGEDNSHDDDESDDDFGTDRDINWADARQRRKSKSPLRGRGKPAEMNRKVDEVVIEESMAFDDHNHNEEHNHK